ncbi:MAG: hypothetical protein PHV02_16120 [Rhodocyclaceae bacterium]|nr:hypothetical protein [Rhodocyclaceae bacterium]
MKQLIVVLLSTFAVNFVYAADDCAAKAAEKKLAGAAKTSFLKKCTADNMSPAQASCDAKAKEKKLAGAAKNSFVKKCVSEAESAK